MSEGLSRLRRLFADHAGSEGALLTLRMTMGERAPALAWTAWRAGLFPASNPEGWSLMSEARMVQGEDVREFLFAWAVAQEAGSWCWDAALDAVLDAAGDFGPILEGLDRLPEPGRTQLACALARMGWLSPASLPDSALRIAARAFVNTWSDNLDEVAKLWPPARWAAAVRAAVIELGRVSGPDRIRPLLADATPREVAAVVRVGGWPQLGIWAARDRGPAVAGAFFVELDGIEAPSHSGGVLGLMLGLARFAPLPLKFDTLLRGFLTSVWAGEIQQELRNTLLCIPHARREEMLLREPASMPWALLDTCPTARVCEAAVAAVIAHPTSGASYTYDLVGDALVALGARDEIRAVVLKPLPARARQILVNALARLATQDDRKLLASLVEDPDVEVRVRARWGLEQLGAKPNTEPADALVRAYLDALAKPGGYANAWTLYNELDALGKVRRFAEVLLDAPPTHLVQVELSMLAMRPGLAEVADAVSRRLCADHPHGAALFDWLASLPGPTSARRKALRRGLADRRPMVVSICRAALLRCGEDVGSGPIWDFEQALPIAPRERFVHLAGCLAELGKLGRFTLALWRAGARPTLVVSGCTELEEEFASAARALGAFRCESEAPPMEQFGRLTGALEPLCFHPLDGPLLEPLAPDSVDLERCTRERAEEILGGVLKLDSLDNLRTRSDALFACLLDSIDAMKLNYWRTDRRLVLGFADTGIFFASADFRTLGLVWYDNDQ